jgi:sulfonate transport system substrate-binding protein
MLARRSLLSLLPAVAIAPTARGEPPTQFRIGYQKNGILVVAKQQQAIENRLRPLGVTVSWTEFSFGPPLLEALRLNNLDFGTVGDTPPIFAQAARADLLYVAALPAGSSSSAILLPAGSTLQTLADLKGRRVAFARGSAAHNLTVAALEKAGLSFNDIVPIQLAPADAARPSRAAASMPGPSGTPITPSPKCKPASGFLPDRRTSHRRIHSICPHAATFSRMR